MAKKGDMVSAQNSGFFNDIIFRIKLIWRLMKDPRVSILLKLLPVGALVYIISPIDLIPAAVIPVIGALDDAAALWIGTSLFVALCPDEVVQEHTNALHKVVEGSWRDVPDAGDRRISEREKGGPDEK